MIQQIHSIESGFMLNFFLPHQAFHSTKRREFSIFSNIVQEVILQISKMSRNNVRKRYRMIH